MKKKNMICNPDPLVQIIAMKVINNSIINPSKIAKEWTDDFNKMKYVRSVIRHIIREIANDNNMYYLRTTIIAKGIMKVYYQVQTKSYIEEYMLNNSKNVKVMDYAKHSRCFQKIIQIN